MELPHTHEDTYKSNKNSEDYLKIIGTKIISNLAVGVCPLWKGKKNRHKMFPFVTTKEKNNNKIIINKYMNK